MLLCQPRTQEKEKFSVFNKDDMQNTPIEANSMLYPIDLTRDDGTCSKITTMPRLHKIIHVIWTCNTVRASVFFTDLFLWDSAQAKFTSLIFQIEAWW